jgi:hypothetical protein
MGRKKLPQYLVVQNGKKKIIISMDDILDIVDDPRVTMPNQTGKPYVIVFPTGEAWISPLPEETIKRFKKYKGVK